MQLSEKLLAFTYQPEQICLSSLLCLQKSLTSLCCFPQNLTYTRWCLSLSIQPKQEPKTIRPELFLKPNKYKVAIAIVLLDHPLKSFSSYLGHLKIERRNMP